MKRQRRIIGDYVNKPKACEICGLETRTPQADHCHKSGKQRGWLCKPCNLGLGHFKDNPDALRQAISYLEKYGSDPALTERKLLEALRNNINEYRSLVPRWLTTGVEQ